MQAHASERMTTAIDLAVTFSRDNRERIARALERIDARIMGPNGEIAANRPTAEFLGAGDMWFFKTRHGKLDVIAPPANPYDYVGLRDRALEIDLEGMIVPVASRDDLLKMKRAAGRPRDLDDIAHLESLDD